MPYPTTFQATFYFAILLTYTTAGDRSGGEEALCLVWGGGVGGPLGALSGAEERLRRGRGADAPPAGSEGVAEVVVLDGGEEEVERGPSGGSIALLSLKRSTIN